MKSFFAVSVKQGAGVFVRNRVKNLCGWNGLEVFHVEVVSENMIEVNHVL